MKAFWKRSATLAAACLAVGLAMALPSAAQEEVDDECVLECRETAKDCAFDAREAGRECLEEAGCDVLRDAYRETCLVADRDDELCATARDELRDCVGPCRELMQELRVECREQFNECLSTECGIDDPPRHRHDRFRRDRACYESCLEREGEEASCREECTHRAGRHRGRGNQNQGPRFR